MLDRDHLSDTELLRFVDGENSRASDAQIERHLQTCTRCRTQLDELKRASGVYTAYHASVLKASLPEPEQWPVLKLEAGNQEPQRRWFRFAPALVAVVLLCTVALTVFLIYSFRPHRRMTNLLAGAQSVTTSRRTRLRISWKGQEWYRPAILPGQAALTNQASTDNARSLFVRANYSWQDPLSARSFAAWRNQLLSKRDEVTTLRGRDRGVRLYRLRTATPTGALRSVSITLRADTLHATEGQFNFEDQPEMTMAESGELPEPATSPPSKKASSSHVLTESKASIEDELRVFAALNEVGADAGEPVTVNFDQSGRHVVVTGVGLPFNRQLEIEQVLRSVPNAVARFEHALPPSGTRATAQSTTDMSPGTAPLRRDLESRAGSPQRLQELTDGALDTSETMLAHAHALVVLAETFSPAIELRFSAADRRTLFSLRRRHAAIIVQSVEKLRGLLEPFWGTTAKLNETDGSGQPSWHSVANQLFRSCQKLDAELSQLLAGSYSQEAGQDILRRVPDDIDRVEKLARVQEDSP